MLKQLKQARTALQVSSFSDLQKASVHLAFLDTLASLQTLKFAVTTSACVSSLLPPSRSIYQSTNYAHKRANQIKCPDGIITKISNLILPLPPAGCKHMVTGSYAYAIITKTSILILAGSYTVSAILNEYKISY